MSVRPVAKRARNDYSRAAFEALLRDNSRLFKEAVNAKGAVAYLPRGSGPCGGNKATADHAKECTLVRFLLKASEASLEPVYHRDSTIGGLRASIEGTVGLLLHDDAQWSDVGRQCIGGGSM